MLLKMLLKSSIYLKGRGIIYLLVHSPNALNSWGCARPKSEAQKLSTSPIWATRTQGLESSLDTLRVCRTESGTRIQTQVLQYMMWASEAAFRLLHLHLPLETYLRKENGYIVDMHAKNHNNTHIHEKNQNAELKIIGCHQICTV